MDWERKYRLRTGRKKKKTERSTQTAFCLRSVDNANFRRRDKTAHIAYLTYTLVFIFRAAGSLWIRHSCWGYAVEEGTSIGGFDFPAFPFRRFSVHASIARKGCAVACTITVTSQRKPRLSLTSVWLRVLCVLGFPENVQETSIGTGLDD